MLRRRNAAALLALALALGACGGDDEPVATGADATTTTSAAAGGDLAVVLCDDLPSLSGDPVVDGPLSSDEAVAAAQQERARYGAPSDEASTVVAIAAGPSAELGFPFTAEEEAEFLAFNSGAAAGAAQERYFDEPWYAGVWVDNAGRTDVLATTDDVAALQAEVDAELGAGLIRVVAAERSQTQLEALQSAVTAWIEDHPDLAGGSGQATDRNVVSVFLEVLDPGVGAPYDTGFAGSPEELAALWAEIGLDGEPPTIDFAEEVVVWFGPAVSGSCDDVRMDDVVLDADVLRPEIVLPGGARDCTDDANPHAYVVAYERARLPERFTISVAPNDSCCPEATTEVELGFNG